MAGSNGITTRLTAERLGIGIASVYRALADAKKTAGMIMGQIGSAIVFNNLWLLMTLMPFALAIRYGVVSREEAYLARKFGDAYRGYCSRVRRWL